MSETASAWLMLGERVSPWFQPLTDSQQQLHRACGLSSSHSTDHQQARALQQQLGWFSDQPLTTLDTDHTSPASQFLLQQLTGLTRQEAHTIITNDGWPDVARLLSSLLLDQQQRWPSLYSLEKPLEQQLAGSYGLVVALFCTAMMRMIQAHAQQQLQGRQRQEVSRIIAQFEHWARLCPDNFAAPLSLLQAEYARLCPQHNAAACFEQALKLCEQQPVLCYQALSYERYAEFLHTQQPRLARFCLQEASDRYQRWGASQKVKLLADTLARLAQ